MKHSIIKTSPKRPRNPFVALARLRAAGPHRRSRGAERQRAKRELQRQIG